MTEDEEDDFDPMETEDDEAEVEVESEGEDEFSHFEDDEEFEGFKQEGDGTDDPEEFVNGPKAAKQQEKPTPPPLKQPIKIVNIPAHLRWVLACQVFDEDCQYGILTIIPAQKKNSVCVLISHFI